MEHKKSCLETKNNKSIIINYLSSSFLKEILTGGHFGSLIERPDKSVIVSTEKTNFDTNSAENSMHEDFATALVTGHTNALNQEWIAPFYSMMHSNQKFLPKDVQVTFKYFPKMSMDELAIIRKLQHQMTVYELPTKMVDVICPQLGIEQFSHNRINQTVLLPRELPIQMTVGYLMHRIMNCDQQKLRLLNAENLVNQNVRFHNQYPPQFPFIFDGKFNEEKLFKWLNNLNKVNQDMILKGMEYPRGFTIFFTLSNENLEYKFSISIEQDIVTIKLIDSGKKRKPEYPSLKMTAAGEEAFNLMFEPPSAVAAAPKKTQTPGDYNFANSSEFGPQQQLTQQNAQVAKLASVKEVIAVVNHRDTELMGEPQSQRIIQTEENERELSNQAENICQQLIDENFTRVCDEQKVNKEFVEEIYLSLVDDLVKTITKKQFDRVQYDLRLMRCYCLHYRATKSANEPKGKGALGQYWPKLDLWQLLSQTLPQITPEGRRFYKLIISLPAGSAGDKLEQELDRDLLKDAQDKDALSGDFFYMQGFSQGIALSVVKLRSLRKCSHLGHANGIICFGNGHQLLDVRQRLQLLAKITLCPYLIFVIDRISSQLDHREHRHQSGLIKALLMKEQKFVFWRIYKYRPGGLIPSLQSAIKCLAALPGVNSEGALQQVGLHDFLINHLGVELFQRIRKDSAVFQLCQKFPQLCRQIYNEAVQRLQLVAGEDLSMMPQLPQELYKYVEQLATMHTNRWEYFQPNWQSKASRQLIVQLMDKIKMPPLCDLPQTNEPYQCPKDYKPLMQKENCLALPIESYLNGMKLWVNKRLSLVLSQKDTPSALVYQLSSLQKHYQEPWFYQFVQTTKFKTNLDKILMPPPPAPSSHAQLGYDHVVSMSVLDRYHLRRGLNTIHLPRGSTCAVLPNAVQILRKVGQKRVFERSTESYSMIKRLRQV